MENQNLKYVEREVEDRHETEEYEMNRRRGITITDSLTDIPEPGFFGIGYTHEPVKVRFRMYRH